jgi:hypothetical protein
MFKTIVEKITKNQTTCKMAIVGLFTTFTLFAKIGTLASLDMDIVDFVEGTRQSLKCMLCVCVHV